MEIQSSYMAITFILFVSILWLARKLKQNSLTHNLPPGPWKLPLIGNLHQLAAAGSLPHHALRELALKYGPLMHLQLGEVSAVVVSSPEITKDIMKTHDHAFLQRPVLHSFSILTYGLADIAFSPYGDYWRQMRKICTLELLSSKRVQSFSFIREQEVAKLIESIHSSAGSPINLTTRVYSLVSTIVSRATFGNKSKDQEEFVSVVKQVVAVTGGFDLVDLFPSLKPIHVMTRMNTKLEKMHKKQDMILEDIVKEHQVKRMRSKEGTGEEEPENLVDVLLRVQQSGSLEVPVTTDNIKAIIWVSNSITS